jgi:hypothetical protein
MLFNVNFNNISVINIVAVSCIGVAIAPEKRKLLTNFITSCCIEYTSPRTLIPTYNVQRSDRH